MPVILVENGLLKGRRLPLDPAGICVFGREPGIAVLLADPMVSRRHFTVEGQGGRFVLKDLGSANGTLLNGERVKERVLQIGDRIRAGDTLFTFVSSEAADPLIGKHLRGYEVLERIGRGGMGTVFMARQVSLERLVALKLLSPELMSDPTFVSRFLEEARSAARLNHPSIVMVYDIDEVDLEGRRLVYYSMEYMAGGSVEDLLHREKRFDPARAIDIALQTAEGLLYAERVGIVHRDIKPGNLMIHESGAVKIGDLGIATQASGTGSMASQRGGVSGSPHYMSPEQARGLDLDSRADIYSLGASLFQMLAGHPPFSGTEAREVVLKHMKEPPPDLAAVRPDLPSVLPPLVGRMLEKDRDRRFANPRQLIAALEKARAALNAPAPLPPAQVSRAPRLLIGSIVLLALLGGGWGAYHLQKGWQERREAESRLRERIEKELNEAERALVAGDSESSAQTAVDRAAAALALLVRVDPTAAARLESLQERLHAMAASKAERRREETAAADLAALRAALPDVHTVRSTAELEALIPLFGELEKRHPGTPAAREAVQEAGRLRQAVRDLESKLRRSEDAMRVLSITAGTFLDARPPRYREALVLLRAPPAEIAGTPAEERLQKRVEEVVAAMVRDAGIWIREANDAAAAGNPETAARNLDRLRDRVDGEALASIEAALRAIREGSSGSPKKDSP